MQGVEDLQLEIRKVEGDMAIMAERLRKLKLEVKVQNFRATPPLGSKPRERRAKALAWRREGLLFREIAAKLGISAGRAAQLCERAERDEHNLSPLFLPLSSQACNILANHAIIPQPQPQTEEEHNEFIRRILGFLHKTPDRGILDMKNVGLTRLVELRAFQQAHENGIATSGVRCPGEASIRGY